jgi:hypothetical protein
MLLSRGFLGTEAPFAADLVLLLETTMAMTLLVGAWLARQRRFKEHAWCQSAVVLLNAVVIGVSMLPSFRQQIAREYRQSCIGFITGLQRRTLHREA